MQTEYNWFSISISQMDNENCISFSVGFALISINLRPLAISSSQIKCVFMCVFQFVPFECDFECGWFCCDFQFWNQAADANFNWKLSSLFMWCVIKSNS